jgi:hypothetical protein
MTILIKDNQSGKQWDADSKESLLALWKEFDHTPGDIYTETNEQDNPTWISLMRDDGEWQLNAGEDETPFEPTTLSSARFTVTFDGMIPKEEVEKALRDQIEWWSNVVVQDCKRAIRYIASALHLNLEEEKA